MSPAQRLAIFFSSKFLSERQNIEADSGQTLYGSTTLTHCNQPRTAKSHAHQLPVSLSVTILQGQPEEVKCVLHINHRSGPASGWTVLSTPFEKSPFRAWHPVLLSHKASLLPRLPLQTVNHEKWWLTPSIPKRINGLRFPRGWSWLNFTGYSCCYCSEYLATVHVSRILSRCRL